MWSRLKAGMSLSFQFHKGTIRTLGSFAGIGNLLLFQFHKGTIRTITRNETETFIRHFNSIKVRLEPHSQDRRNRAAEISIP